MAKRVQNVDPEKYIVGRGCYTNLQTANVFYDDHVVRIEPVKFPVLMVIIHDLLFAVFFVGMHFCIQYSRSQGQVDVRDDWIRDYGVIGIGVMTCFLFTVVVYSTYRNERRRGPWLIYDKITKQVNLPRDGVRFERTEIVHLQYITTRRLNGNKVDQGDSLSEINLITCRDGERKRWPLLRSTFNVRAFDFLLKPIVQQTDLPVMRVTEEILGGGVKEQVYGHSGDE